MSKDYRPGEGMMRNAYDRLKGDGGTLVELLNPGEQPTCAKEELNRWLKQLEQPVGEGAPLPDPVLGLKNHSGSVLHFTPPIDGSRLAEWFPQLRDVREIRYIQCDTDRGRLEVHGPVGSALEGNLGSIDPRLATVNGADEIILSADGPNYSVSELYGRLSGLGSIDTRFKSLQGVTGVTFPFAPPSGIHFANGTVVDLAPVLPTNFPNSEAQPVLSEPSHIDLLPDGGVHVVGSLMDRESNRRLLGHQAEALIRGGNFYFAPDGTIRINTDPGEGGYG